MNLMLDVRIVLTIVVFSAWLKKKVTSSLDLVDIDKMLNFWKKIIWKDSKMEIALFIESFLDLKDALH
jgi:hypothetical protein